MGDEAALACLHMVDSFARVIQAVHVIEKPAKDGEQSDLNHPSKLGLRPSHRGFSDWVSTPS